jgi:hypothetical protein
MYYFFIDDYKPIPFTLSLPHSSTRILPYLRNDEARCTKKNNSESACPLFQ